MKKTAIVLLLKIVISFILAWGICAVLAWDINASHYSNFGKFCLILLAYMIFSALEYE